MKNKLFIFSLVIFLTTTLTTSFIISNQDIENMINNSNVSQLNKLLDNKTGIKKSELKKYILLADQVVKKANNNLKKRFNFKRVSQFINGIGTVAITSIMPIAGYSELKKENFSDKSIKDLVQIITVHGVFDLLAASMIISGLNKIYKGYDNTDYKNKLYKAVYVRDILRNKLSVIGQY